MHGKRAKGSHTALVSTWSKEGQIEEEAQQHEPGVGRRTVVVGPEQTACSPRLVGAAGRRENSHPVSHMTSLDLLADVTKSPGEPDLPQAARLVYV